METSTHKKQILGLTSLTLSKLDSVFHKHSSIEAVLIYGSRAKGNYKRGSDIDLTIKGALLSFSELMQIEDEIDDLYLPYQVDLSQYEAIENSDLLDHINRVGVTIYSNGQVVDN
ncbi:MAG: nucleotidyltransferase domain-containing protein [Pseudomonadales bacterium]|nr:nucleotidyltransferase domain-containing protein [Pseudomonadales bacterium]